MDLEVLDGPDQSVRGTLVSEITMDDIDKKKDKMNE